jgi:hypothetical protein
VLLWPSTGDKSFVAALGFLRAVIKARYRSGSDRNPILRLSLAAPKAVFQERGEVLRVEPIEVVKRLTQRGHVRGAIMPEESIKPPSRSGMFWPAFAVGVGLLGVLVWTLFLGWVLGRALLAIR